MNITDKNIQRVEQAIESYTGLNNTYDIFKKVEEIIYFSTSDHLTALKEMYNITRSDLIVYYNTL
tara:strand:+ start:2233 stop:2427 length:195 start_codon:yes stop_codon:yes gene_type:complete